MQQVDSTKERDRLFKKVEFCIKFTPNSTQIQKGTFTKISYSISYDMRNSAAIRSTSCLYRRGNRIWQILIEKS